MILQSRIGWILCMRIYKNYYVIICDQQPRAYFGDTSVAQQAVQITMALLIFYGEKRSQ